MIASATAEHYRRAIEFVANDPNVDALVAIFLPPLVTRAEDVAAAIMDAASQAEPREAAAVGLHVIAGRAGPAEELRAAHPLLRVPGVGGDRVGPRCSLRRVAGPPSRSAPDAQRVAARRGCGHRRGRAWAGWWLAGAERGDGALRLLRVAVSRAADRHDAVRGRCGGREAGPRGRAQGNRPRSAPQDRGRRRAAPPQWCGGGARRGRRDGATVGLGRRCADRLPGPAHDSAAASRCSSA